MEAVIPAQHELVIPQRPAAVKDYVAVEDTSAVSIKKFLTPEERREMTIPGIWTSVPAMTGMSSLE